MRQTTLSAIENFPCANAQIGSRWTGFKAVLGIALKVVLPTALQGTVRSHEQKTSRPFLRGLASKKM